HWHPTRFLGRTARCRRNVGDEVGGTLSGASHRRCLCTPGVRYKHGSRYDGSKAVERFRRADRLGGVRLTQARLVDVTAPPCPRCPIAHRNWCSLRPVFMHKAASPNLDAAQRLGMIIPADAGTETTGQALSRV